MQYIIVTNAMGGILMTDSEKFDLLLSEVRSIRSETQDMKKDMMGVGMNDFSGQEGAKRFTRDKL